MPNTGDSVIVTCARDGQVFKKLKFRILHIQYDYYFVICRRLGVWSEGTNGMTP